MPAVIGREREIEWLRALICSAVQGTGKVVVLEGEAGIGKTTVLKELRQTATHAGFLTLWGRAEELESRTPLSALLDLLDESPEAAGTSKALKALLKGSIAAGLPERPDHLAYAAGEAVVEFLSEQSLAQPIALLLDDLQWADLASMQALLRLARVAGHLPVMLVLAARPGPRGTHLDSFLTAVQGRGALSERLGALPDSALHSFVQAHTGATPGPTLIEQLRLCAGNPLFLTVTLDELTRTGTLSIAEGQAEVSNLIPRATLPVTILQRLRFCSADTLKLMTFASVAGRSFSVGELAAAAQRPVSEILPALRDGMQAGILSEEGAYLVFRHDVIRDALYFDLPPSVRGEIHLKIAQSLRDAGERPSRVAEHLLRSAPAGRVELLRATAIEVIGDAPDVAADLLQAALERSSAAEKKRVLPELSIALILSDNSSRGIDLCRECIEIGLRSNLDESLHFVLAKALTAKGELQDALQAATAGLSDPATPADQYPRLQAISGVSRLFMGDLPGAEMIAQQAIAGAREFGDPATESRAVLTLALVAHLQGRFAEGLTRATESIRLAELVRKPESFHHVPHAVHASALIDLGRIDDALTTARRGLKIVESLAVEPAMVWMQSTVATCLFLLGSWSEADTEAKTALEIAAETGAGWTCFALATRAMVALQRGELSEATALAVEMENDLERVGAGGLNTLTIPAQACLLEAQGFPEEAFQKIESMWLAFGSYGIRAELPGLVPYLTWLAFSTGETAILESIATEMSGLHAVNPEVAHLKALGAWAAALAEHDSSQAVQAMSDLSATPRRLDTAVAGLATGLALIEWGRSEEATGVLLRCLDEFEQLGAGGFASKARSQLRRIGAVRGHHGKRHRPRTGWDSLTDTELKIVRLVAERLSNPQIAQRLVVSKRTVETHVSHCLAKLNLSSRVELAARASDQFGWKLSLQELRE